MQVDRLFGETAYVAPSSAVYTRRNLVDEKHTRLTRLCRAKMLPSADPDRRFSLRTPARTIWKIAPCFSFGMIIVSRFYFLSWACDNRKENFHSYFSSPAFPDFSALHFSLREGRLCKEG
jgi:hypothetical protein